MRRLRKIYNRKVKFVRYAVNLAANVSLTVYLCNRFLLRALDMYWHEDCLKCGCCDCRLSGNGSTLYIRANLVLCRQDYLR